jgi:hypothetical protein
VILFGLGGIFTEILDDVSIRKCPITLEEASDMIKELRSKKLFEGFRGINLNVDILKKDLASVSKIPQKNKDILELDINPYILNSKEGKAVDIRIKVVIERLLTKGINFEISESALSHLAKVGYDPHFGARPLNRLIQNKILNPVATFIISNGVKKGDTVLVGMKGDELSIVTKKGKIKSSIKVRKNSTV